MVDATTDPPTGLERPQPDPSFAAADLVEREPVAPRDEIVRDEVPRHEPDVVDRDGFRAGDAAPVEAYGRDRPSGGPGAPRQAAAREPAERLDEPAGGGVRGGSDERFDQRFDQRFGDGPGPGRPALDLPDPGAGLAVGTVPVGAAPAPTEVVADV
ncbi:hypothetical protein, partial [Pseudonocardia dioxanivorans]